MHHTLIRKLSLTDLDLLQRLGRQTFQETFSEHNSEEDMQRYLDTSFATEKLAGELSHPYSEFYLAEEDGQAAGYLKLNFETAQTELKNEKAVEIERIYVLKDYLGRKLGQLLYEQALAVARQRRAPYLWLGVWEENARAIAFYRKNGFTAFDQHIFQLGEDRQTDILMKLELE